MSLCGNSDGHGCEESSSVSAASEEGKWVGITICLWILIVVLAWVIRTCTQPQRRQKIIRKLLCCYDKLHWPEEVAGTGTGNHRQCCENGSAIPNGHPPSYKEAIKSESPRNGQLHFEHELDMDDDDDYDDFDDANGLPLTADISVSWAKYGRFRKRLSRSSLNSLSITLPTIEEDDNEVRASSQKELRCCCDISVVTAAPRSQSLPDKLSEATGNTSALTADREHVVQVAKEEVDQQQETHMADKSDRSKDDDVVPTLAEVVYHNVRL